MAWVKLDDSMPHHPKILAAGPLAFALDVAAICYSNRYATDGFIARSVLRTCLPGVRNVQEVARKLVECGRWVETDEGWLIHDIDEYQPTAEEQKNISRARAEAGRKGGKASGQTRANRKQAASKPEARPKQVASKPANPDPTRPDPTPPTDLHVLPQAPPEGGSGGEVPALPAEKWARTWCEIRGVEPTRAILRGLVPKVIEYIGDAGEPTEEQLREAHRHGIEHPGGWGFYTNRTQYDPDEEPDWIKEFKI